MLKNIFKLQLFKFMVLMLKGELSEFYDQLLRPYHLPHVYNTRSQLFRYPMLTCEVERRAVPFQIISLHKKIPTHFYVDESVSSSVRKYKKFLGSNQ